MLPQPPHSDVSDATVLALIDLLAPFESWEIRNPHAFAEADPAALPLDAGVSPSLEPAAAADPALEAAGEVLKVGDRVVVNGAKIGTLLFVGETKIKPGETLYGVQLDLAEGRVRLGLCIVISV
jgi:hypothetical protein